jgi:alanyl-tRNA synthetase
LRKCFNISEKEFKTGNLLPSTIPVVAEILGETFTELNEKMPLVLDLVKYEEELYKSLRQMMSKDVTRIVNENPKLAELELFDYPGFVQGYGEVLNFKKNNDKMSGEFMYYIHSSFGFDLEFIERLASLENMKTDRKAFETKIAEVKRVSSGQSMSDDVILSLDNILNVKTDESRKYNYIYDESAQIYKLPKVKAKVLKIIDGKDSIENSKDSSNKTIKLVLDKSPFYYESGGQEADKGTIIIGNEEFPLISLSKIKNCILHEIQLKDNSNISVNDEIELHVNENRRSGLIRNHSATHLLNSAIRKITNSPVYQKSSLVSEDKLRMEIACFGPKLKPEITQQIEDLIRFNINTKPLNASIRVINSQALENENDVIMVPGEIYPDEGIRLITFGDVSKELCCGTHVFNTQELLEFTFLGMRTTGRNSYLFTAATGETAKQAISFGDQLINELNQLSAGITSQNFNDVLTKVREISAKLSNSNLQISLNKKLKCHEIIAEVKEKFKHESREILGVLLDIEMKDLLERSPHSPYLIHSLECSDLMKSVSLLKATRYVRDRPVMIFSVTDNSIIKARCCVPSKLATESFNAEIWLREASKILRSSISPPKDQNPWETCNMKEKKVKPDRIDETLNKAIESADDFAKNFFKRQLKQAENI